MSIQMMIQANLGHRLFLLEPAIKSDDSVRITIVSQEVLDAVDHQFSEHWDGLRLADFRDALDTFTRGDAIVVSDNPFKKPNDCFLSRVSPVEQEVVDIRTMLGPGIRCFGAVAEHNCFVALTWEYREDTDFDYEIKRCSHEWKKIFGSEIPFSKGKNLTECISGAYSL